MYVYIIEIDKLISVGDKHLREMDRTINNNIDQC